MPQVVIARAGVIGASIAWHLGELGCRDVVVLDRAPALGGGSTPLATGGFPRSSASTAAIGRTGICSSPRPR